MPRSPVGIVWADIIHLLFKLFGSFFFRIHFFF